MALTVQALPAVCLRVALLETVWEVAACAHHCAYSVHLADSLAEAMAWCGSEQLPSLQGGQEHVPISHAASFQRSARVHALKDLLHSVSAHRIKLLGTQFRDIAVAHLG